MPPEMVTPTVSMLVRPQAWQEIIATLCPLAHTIYTMGIGAHRHTVGIGAHNHTVALGAHSHVIHIRGDGNAETTVKNIAFNYILRLA